MRIGSLLGVLSIVNETVLFIMVMKQPLIVSFPEGAFQKLNIKFLFSIINDYLFKHSQKLNINIFQVLDLNM